MAAQPRVGLAAFNSGKETTDIDTVKTTVLIANRVEYPIRSVLLPGNNHVLHTVNLCIYIVLQSQYVEGLFFG